MTSIGIVSFFCLQLSIMFGQQTLTVTNCNSGEPISDIYILDAAQKELFGFTNGKGEIVFNDSDKSRRLHFKKTGSIDSTLIITSYQTKICLLPKVNRLKTVEINSNTIPLNEQFESFIEKTVRVLPIEDDSLYYSFQYTMTLPDSGWKANVSGIVIIPTRSYEKAYSGGYGGKFCSLKIDVNPEFYNSSLFSKLNSSRLCQYFINYDLLRKRYSYRTRIKEFMVDHKILREDSTIFSFNDCVAGKSTRIFSTPVFNTDSILMQDKARYEHYDKSYKNENSTLVNLEESILNYRLEDELRIKYMDIVSKYNWEGINYIIQFHAKLLDRKEDSCANIHIMTHFDKTSIAEHPEIQVEFYPSDSTKVSGADSP